MKHTEYSLMICGATFAGLGAAAAAQEANRKTIVIERTALVGREFIDAFNPGQEWGFQPTTPLGRKFKDEIMVRNLMEKDGPMHLPALHPVLCLLIKEYELHVSFLTEIIGVTEQNGRFLVTLFNASGLHQVLVDEILDTSTQRLTQPGRLFAPTHRRVNAYLHHPAIREAVIPASLDDTMSIAKGRFPSEVILRVSLPPKYDWQQARQWLYQYWEARPEEWVSWTIAAMAGTFESVVRRGPQHLVERWTWVPSEGFDHPFEAIDAGYDYSMNTEGLHDEAAI